MVDRNLLRDLDLGTERWESELAEAFGELAQDDIDWSQLAEIQVNQILEGRVLRVDREYVAVDVGFKSEGLVPLNEWDEHDPPLPGQAVKVLIEDIEDQGGSEDPRGMILLSKRKAEKIEVWQKVMGTLEEGAIVKGEVTRKIKGGLLVDIGVNVFLPASQVDIRRPGDIGDYQGRTIECVVLKIDEGRRNIVVSRRALIEAERAEKKSQLLDHLEVGQIRKGVVKNIADFGAFVDLGGIDGLLHITDMSWGRIGHPNEMISIDEELEVKILNIDREKEKIALGLKQKSPSPWENVDVKYPVNQVIKGEVVNVMSYGAFVKLEPGIEGLVHISEMSWTKRINHPSELVQIGDEVEVIVLNIDKHKQEISLGMKQTQSNPWDKVAEKYPPGTMVTGKVRNLTNYGAFVEIEEGIDGLLHVSDMSWTRKIGHPSEMLEKGQQVSCKVISVDQERRRIALGLKQMEEDPWATDIPSKFQPGQVIKGKVTKLTNFGVFVSLGNGLEGLLHVSELADHKVDNPESVVKLGEEIEVKVLRVDTEERKIGLSRKRVDWTDEQNAAQADKENNASSGGGANAGGGGSAKEPRERKEPKQSAELKGGVGESGPLIK